MKQLISILLLLTFVIARAQNNDTIVVNYYENFPYAYTENGKLKGIEIDIINEYANWLKVKKNISVVLSFKAYSDFSAFYAAVKEGKDNVIGAGSVTISDDREKDVAFSPNYMHNVAVLISSGTMPTVREKTKEQIAKIFGNAKGVAVKGSSHLKYMNAIKANYLPLLDIRTVDNQSAVLQSILADNTTIGYVDIVAYWAFMKTNASKFLKIQKVFTATNEGLGYIMPIKNKHAALISEFFESGFGFTATKSYRQILERYLGEEVLDSVEIK